MARLKDFINYLKDRRKVMAAVERQLCQLQEKYETYFQEIAKVREQELAQLTEHIVADRSKLPGELNLALDQAEQEQEHQLEVKLKHLRTEHKELTRKAEQERSRSRKAELKVRSKNAELDHHEEQLKARNAELLAQIEQHNQRIEQLGKGWGFFANLFRMKEIANAREALDQEQTDLAARIHQLRAAWVDAEQDHAQREQKMSDRWVELTTRAAAVQTKLQHLERSRPSLILRSTMEQVLFERQPELPGPADDDPPCPRCEARNPQAAHFCRICARRLHGDRPDLQGSLLEVAELNLHHARFSDGMQACQQLIGLVRGLGSGVEAFTESVQDVKASEDTHPLPKLNIDVPRKCVAYGEYFDKLSATIKERHGLHPQAFAAKVDSYVDDIFTEERIKKYFERMGEELSRQADSQW